MIVRSLEDLAERGAITEAETWVSRRLLLAGDGMGFSMHDTVLHTGTWTAMWYRNHLEAVYCIEGRGRLIDLDRREVHDLAPGTVYALDQHDRHVLVADERLRMVCTFKAPVVGTETHDETGAYPLLVLDDEGAVQRAPDLTPADLAPVPTVEEAKAVLRELGRPIDG